MEKLPAGARGWIPLADAADLFSTEERQYAFGELDDAGKNRLATFAANYRCTPDFRPTEGRMYFRKKQLSESPIARWLPLGLLS